MAVHKHYKTKKNSEHPTKYIEFDHKNSKVDMELVRGKNVCWVDCHPGRAVLEEMKPICNTLLVIEHHKGSDQELEGLGYVVFCQELCAFQMTWVFCMGYSEPISQFADYIYARDMWKWKEVPNSETISAGINMMRLDIENYDLLLQMCDEELIGIWKKLGTKKYEQDQKKAREIAEGRQLWDASVPVGVFDSVPTDNSNGKSDEDGDNSMSQAVDGTEDDTEEDEIGPMTKSVDTKMLHERVSYVHTNKMVSDVGNIMVKEPGATLAVLTYYKAPSDQNPQPDIGLSFRSEEGKRSAMKMAQLFGGNGHEAAAGGNTILGLARTIWAEHFGDVDNIKLSDIGDKEAGLNEKTLKLLKDRVLDCLNSGSIYNIPIKEVQ
jgi:oligoribonuclease NrnB/cAMP/cGMP phosphodiesterase (DHH superfamily)